MGAISRCRAVLHCVGIVFKRHFQLLRSFFVAYGNEVKMPALVRTTEKAKPTFDWRIVLTRPKED